MTKKFSSKHPLTEAEEAEVQRMIASDPDNPEITDAQATQRMTFGEAMRQRGRPKALNPKTQVTLRLDADLLEHLRATGPGWQGRVNDALRKAEGL